jgi:hypothetical protein
LKSLCEQKVRTNTTLFISLGPNSGFSLPEVKSKDELKPRSVILPKAGPIQELEDAPGAGAQQEQDESEAVPKKMKKKFLDFGEDTKSSTPLVSTTLLPGQFFVPVTGKNDIVLQSRFLPCRDGTMGIIVEIKMPNHVREHYRLATKLFLRCQSSHGA